MIMTVFKTFFVLLGTACLMYITGYLYINDTLTLMQVIKKLPYHWLIMVFSYTVVFLFFDKY